MSSMVNILPGSPVPAEQAICIGLWDGEQFIAYITDNSVVILTSSYEMLQVINNESEEQLKAITLDEVTGKLAVCAECDIRIYSPFRLDENLRVRTDLNITSGRTLSWGCAEELLVGGSFLELFSTSNMPTRIWKKRLANTVRFADFSYDSAFIASVGFYDRFVKIWRRQSFELDDTRFDFSYLSHPAAVTNIHWRKPYHVDQSAVNVLYTTCTDQVVRIWVASDLHSHCIKHLQLWNEIDLKESIKPRIISKRSMIRYSFIIDNRDFILATERTVQAKSNLNDEEDQALSHLIEVVKCNPDICIVLDDLGHMSAWGLENISCKTIHKTKIFNIAHVNELFLDLPNMTDVYLSQIRCYNYYNKSRSELNILIHYFDGRIEVFESNMAYLFDPSPRSDRFVSKAVLTGHSSCISGLSRNTSGCTFVSWTHSSDAILWKTGDNHASKPILRQSIIIQKEHICKACVLGKQNLIVLMSRDKISLWDTESFEGKLLKEFLYSLEGQLQFAFPLCLAKEVDICHFVAISSKMRGILWEIKSLKNGLDLNNKECRHEIREICHFNINSPDNLSVITHLTTDSPSTLSEHLGIFNTNIALSHSSSGILRLWIANINVVLNRLDCSESKFINTGVVKPALVVANSLRKVAVVNSTMNELSIWSLVDAHVEFIQNYDEQEIIQSLDWTSTSNGQLVLAIRFLSRVIILAQTRYDFLFGSPSWVNIREISICNFTPLPITDSMWICDGDYVVGTGSQIFIFNRNIESNKLITDLGISLSKQQWDIFEIVMRLNSPIPVYHPQFLIQCMFTDKLAYVDRIILELHKTLIYYVEDEPISNYLGLDPDFFYNSSLKKSFVTTEGSAKDFSILHDEADPDETVSQAHLSLITEKLTKVSLYQLTKDEQEVLAKILKCMANLKASQKSTDTNGSKFQFSLLQTMDTGTEEPLLDWREFNWAYHSNCQDILTEMVRRQYHGKILWKHAKTSGMFVWMTDRIKLLAQFEDIAKNEYNKTDLKNPVDCSLYYLALRKKSILVGLWRIATSNQEQSTTINLLSHNFQEKKWKTIAMKNAYVLLGKHRYEYAAAFFLLADCLRDSITVIMTHLKDIQLAIAIARVYEGDESPALIELLERNILPLAAYEGNRWMASWAYWMMHKKDMSLRVLISPTYMLSDLSWAPNLRTKLFSKDDPALTAFYMQLREKITVSSELVEMEWDFVLRNVRLYCRMGCHPLALDLIRNWRFSYPHLISSNNIKKSTSKLSSSRLAPALTDIPSQKSLFGIKTHNQQPSGSLYQEPDSTSLLDSFGF